jgi:Bacterial regulatory proteins, luxR family/AAA ATPase domain
MMREPAQVARGPTVAGPDRRGLRGRDAEIEAIERLMNDARTGRRAGVMTIVGDVGLGKSALLEHAIAAADHMRVLRCVGAPTEATLPFAGLSQMLRPILGLIGQFPVGARLVARGASNRDAAAELFLSPRTVEYHLRKVFTKLGISSRTELVRMTLADELVGSGAGS